MKRKRRSGVEALGEGMFRIRVQVKDPATGTMIERDRRVQAASAAVAIQLRENLLESVRASLSLVDAPQRPSNLGGDALTWLEAQKARKRKGGESRLAPTTIAKYEYNVRDLIAPFFDDVRTEEVTKKRIERWRDQLGAEFASATVNTALNVLRAIFRSYDRTVADSVAPLEEDDSRITDDEPNALTEEETRRFLVAAAKVEPEHCPMLLVMLTGAQRISAVRALRWESVDTVRGEISFRQRVSGKIVLSGVKRSRKAKEVAPLLPEVWSLLEAHRAKFNDKQRESGLVFPSKRTGGFVSRSILDKPLRAILTEAGISKRLTSHGCRRTGTDLYRLVAGSAVSKAIAGHLSDQMHQHYSTVRTPEKMAAAERAFGGLRLVSNGSPVDTSGDDGLTRKEVAANDRISVTKRD